MAVVTLALLAGVAAVALVGLTTLLHHASARTAAGAESVRLADEVQRDLLLHDRVSDASVRAQIAASLEARLRDSRRQLSSAEQVAAHEAAEKAVGDYLIADTLAGISREELLVRHAAAFASLETLIARDLEQARRASATADRYDAVANVIGIGVASGVSLAAILVLWWIHGRALRPLSGLALTMRRFGHGDVEARASERGPAELAEMARQFNQMATAIARQRQERHAFIASVVHDLRTPLSALRMANDLVREKDGHRIVPERASRLREMVARQIDRLERMVGDLLDSVSVEAGKVHLRVGSHDLCEIAAEVVQHYRGTSTKHTLVLDVPDTGMLLRCDAMRVEQVLSNLVSNAIKYSPEGGRVVIALRATEEAARFDVSDEGVGMTDEDAATAFEPFRRSASVTDHIAGSGLGLFVVRRLVEAHGGTIDLRTALGKGSTFEVCLPTVPTSDALLAPDEASGTARSRRNLAHHVA